MPLAARITAKYFVPCYRRIGEISAYGHIQHRFDPRARTDVAICFPLNQFTHMGSIGFAMGMGHGKRQVTIARAGTGSIVD